MMGRPGSGRARTASISLPRSTTSDSSIYPVCVILRCEPSSASLEGRIRTVRPSFEARKSAAQLRRRAHLRMTLNVWRPPSGAGDEERSQPGLDIFRDLVGGAILGVAESAGAGEALVGAGHVIGHPRKRGAGHDRFVRSDLDQIVLRVDAVVLAGGQPRVYIDD